MKRKVQVVNAHFSRACRTCSIVLASCLAWLVLGGCSAQQYAVNMLGEAISGGGSTFASDDDPELVRQALPFSLKLIESALAENPHHRGLLLSACSGFAQYAYAFVHQDADELEGRDLSAATALRDRARKLYLRARDYGLRGLDTMRPQFSDELRRNARRAVRRAGREDIALLYWTAAAWGAAISISKDNPDLIADQTIVEALIDRALDLDESFDAGAIHCFLITYEPTRQGAASPSADRSRRHFERAMQLSGGQSASPLVALAEAVAVHQQNRAEFESLLKKALAVDVNARPQWRLANLVMQRRARWLLSRTDELFAE
jgi:predicted anti-sigma-YlaC factor YlaD